MADNTIGRNVRWLRTQRGLSLTVTAQLAGLSTGYLSKVERGLAPVARRATLEALANGLRVAPSALTGQPYPSSSPAEEAGHAAAQELRAVLRDMELGVLDAADRATPSRIALRQAVRAVNSACAASDYGALGVAVPELIADAHVAARRSSDPDDQVLLAQLLHAAFYLSKDLGHGDLAWSVASRLHATAQTIGRPEWVGLADFIRGHAVVGAQARSRALHLTESAADRIRPDTAESGEVYGMLRLSAALHAAVVGDHDKARSGLDDARRVSTQTGEGDFAGLMFGPRNVGVWGIAVALELGEPGRVPELAEQVDVRAIPSAGRQSTFYCDLARGYAGMPRRERDAIDALLEAEHLAPQRMRTNPYVHDTIGHLLTRAGSRNDQDLRGMAFRAGVTA